MTNHFVTHDNVQYALLLQGKDAENFHPSADEFLHLLGKRDAFVGQWVDLQKDYRRNAENEVYLPMVPSQGQKVLLRLRSGVEVTATYSFGRWYVPVLGRTLLLQGATHWCAYNSTNDAPAPALPPAE